MGLEIINKLKKEKGLTNEKLSELSKVPLGTLAKITSGITKDPKLETLKALARVLECSLEDFDDNSKKQNLTLTKSEEILLSNYNKLNNIGQHEASKRVEELTYIDKYKKEKEHLILKAAHEIEGASEEDKQHDYYIMDDDNF